MRYFSRRKRGKNNNGLKGSGKGRKDKCFEQKRAKEAKERREREEAEGI